VANLSKTLHSNFYQNRSTLAEVMHKSILVCFYAPPCTGIYVTDGRPVAVGSASVVAECSIGICRQLQPTTTTNDHINLKLKKHQILTHQRGPFLKNPPFSTLTKKPATQ